MPRPIRAILILVILATGASSAVSQVDDICHEFGVIPSLDMPWAQVPYLYGKVVLVGFDTGSKAKVTVVFSDRDNPSKKITLSKTGHYCFKRGGSGGTIVVEVDGIEAARRTVPSVGGAQIREDFEIYATTAQTQPPPASISAKFTRPKNDKTVSLYERAAKAEREKDLPAATVFAKQIVEIDPEDFIAWSILGSLYLEQKAFADSDAAFRRSLALQVDYTPAWINVGRLRVAQGQNAAAIEIFKHAAALDPTSARAFKLMGEAYLQTRQGTLAVEALNEALRLDPIGMAECHLLMARLYDAAGAKGLATREFKAFLAKVPDYPEKRKLEKYIKENPE